MASQKAAYARVLIKLSGESLLGKQPYGIDFERAIKIAEEIKEIHGLGVQVAIMIGGGNIFRGIRGTEAGLDRAAADHMGLLGTVINGIALQEALEKVGLFCRHVSAIEIKALAEPFIRRRVIRHLEKDESSSSTPASVALFHHGHRGARALEIKAGCHHESHQGRRRVQRRPVYR
jgi:uridylate kinase